MSTVTFMRAMVCVIVFTGLVGAQPEPPKPKSDAELLEGTWERTVGDGQDKAILQFIIRDAKRGQINFIRETEKPGTFQILGAAGFGYEVDSSGKTKVLALENCLWFEGNKADIEFKFVDGKLCLGEADTKDGISLKGDYTKVKK